jgi:uncharacterized protein (DUF488 family)
MPATPIYTIGYGNRSIENFIKLLQAYNIKYLVDIRSQPYSRYSPTFSQDALKLRLKQQQISYVYMGDALGGRPKDSSCYADDGRVDYTILCEKDFYQIGITRLHKAWEKQYSIALMCSEMKPEECHRGKLVGNTLVEQGLAVSHIDEVGNTKTQDEVNQFFAIEQASGQLSFLDADSQVALNQKTRRSRKKHTSTKESA